MSDRDCARKTSPVTPPPCRPYDCQSFAQQGGMSKCRSMTGTYIIFEADAGFPLLVQVYYHEILGYDDPAELTRP